MNTATPIFRPQGTTGNQCSFLLNPPYVETDWDDKQTVHYIIVVSGADVPGDGPEVMAFPGTRTGQATLSGHAIREIRGTMSHRELLTQMGYTITK